MCFIFSNFLNSCLLSEIWFIKGLRAITHAYWDPEKPICNCKSSHQTEICTTELEVHNARRKEHFWFLFKFYDMYLNFMMNCSESGKNITVSGECIWPFLTPPHTHSRWRIYMPLNEKLSLSQKDRSCWLLFSYSLDVYRNRIEFNGICEKCWPCHCDNDECGTETATQSFKVLPMIPYKRAIKSF